MNRQDNPNHPQTRSGISLGNQELTWETFMEIIMSDSDLKYITDNEMEADAGRTYRELRDVMPDWAHRLHMSGNMLGPDELKTIFEKGLLLWYIKYFTAMPLRLLSVNDWSMDKITFYEFKKNCELAVELKYKLPYGLDDLYHSNSYQQFMLTNGFEHLSTHSYLIGTGLIKQYVKVLKFLTVRRDTLVGNLIGAGNEFKIDPKKLRDNPTITPNAILESIVLADPFISHLGIVFQRWKIVVEKLLNMSGTSLYFSETKEKELNKSIIVLDRILTRIQEMIFYHTRTLCHSYIKQTIGLSLDGAEDGAEVELYPESKDNEIAARPKIYEIPVYDLIACLLQDPNYVMNRPVPKLYAFNTIDLFKGRSAASG